MDSKHLKILKYLPLLSLLGFLGFIKNANNHFNYSRFIFFGFIFAYWEYRFLSSEPKKEILNECHYRTKYIIYPFASILCLVLIFLFHFELISYEELINLAALLIGFLAIIGTFITHRLYNKLSVKQ